LVLDMVPAKSRSPEIFLIEAEIVQSPVVGNVNKLFPMQRPLDSSGMAPFLSGAGRC
jgi:hypothetical protein